MRVLYISGMYPTPAFPQKGIFCHEQVKALKKLGVDVDVVVPIPVYDREVKQNEWTYEGVEIRYVRFFKLPGARDFHKAGKALFWSLDKAVNLENYDLYHADAALPTGQAMMIASEKYGKPFIVHGHGLDVFLEESYKDYSNCKKIVDASIKVYEKAAAVCGVSRKVLDQVSKKINLGNRGHVVYNGVDVEKFRPVHHENKVIKIISIGNLIRLKGHDLTIQAIKTLHNQYNIELEILGHGLLENELKELANKCSYIHFSGYVSYDEVRKRLALSDIFVLPSWYEALGCVYLEAMACAVPTIGCEDNGIDEVIINGENGLLVPSKDEKSLEKSIEILIDKKERIRIGKAGRKTVENNYTWLHSAGSLLNVYEDVIMR